MWEPSAAVQSGPSIPGYETRGWLQNAGFPRYNSPMGMRLQEAVALRTERAAEEFLSAIARVPDDKLEWSPNGDARTPLDILQECGRVNERWAEMLETGQWITWKQDHIQDLIARTSTRESAVAYFSAATERFVAAVRDLPDARLDEPFTAPWRTASTAEWLMHALWHISYHEGQINYIQTLYGDWEYGS